MIGWYLGLVGILISLIGGLYFIKSVLNMSGELKSSIFYLVAASFIYVVFSSIMVIFGFLRYDINKLLWELIPALFFFSSIMFFLGSIKLVKLINKLSKKEGKK